MGTGGYGKEGTEDAEAIEMTEDGLGDGVFIHTEANYGKGAHGSWLVSNDCFSGGVGHDEAPFFHTCYAVAVLLRTPCLQGGFCTSSPAGILRTGSGATS